MLVGGRGRRMDGAVKPLLKLGGVTLLDRIRAALADAGVAPVVAVGPRLDDGDVIWVREDPPYGGPVAGLAAGLATGALDRSDWMLLLAGDLVHPERAVRRLRHELTTAGDGLDAVVPRADGHPQWLAGAYRTAAVRAALAGLGTAEGASCGALFGGLAIRWVVDEDGSTDDIDTPADLVRAREAVGTAAEDVDTSLGSADARAGDGGTADENEETP